MFLERIRDAEDAEAKKDEGKAGEISEVAGETASTAAAADAESGVTAATSRPASSASTTSTVSKSSSTSTPTTLTAFTEQDYDILARKVLNGRQIKNIARTAQALALSEGKRTSLEHVRRVLEVQEAFEQDLKGGTGYAEAMRSYT